GRPPSEAAGSVRRGAGVATARRRPCRSTMRRSRSLQCRQRPVAPPTRTAGRPMRDGASCASRPPGRLRAQSSRKYAADIVSHDHHSGVSVFVVVRLRGSWSRGVGGRRVVGEPASAAEVPTLAATLLVLPWPLFAKATSVPELDEPQIVSLLAAFR